MDATGFEETINRKGLSPVILPVDHAEHGERFLVLIHRVAEIRVTPIPHAHGTRDPQPVRPLAVFAWPRHLPLLVPVHVFALSQRVSWQASLHGSAKVR